jgi:ribosomal protein L37AE/L43A
MSRYGADTEMKCPKCGRFALQSYGEGINCKICGYRLTPGELDKYRLYRMLRDEEKRGSGR